MDDSYPSKGTDAEKRAWADRQTAPAPKSAKPAPAPKKAPSPEDKLREEIESMRYFQTTDDHQ